MNRPQALRKGGGKAVKASLWQDEGEEGKQSLWMLLCDSPAPKSRELEIKGVHWERRRQTKSSTMQRPTVQGPSMPGEALPLAYLGILNGDCSENPCLLWNGPSSLLVM